jgi:large subunit ribosomal protein L18e
MARAYPKSNDELVALLGTLRKAARREKVGLWLDIARRLERPSRSHAEVNLSRIARVAPKGSTIVVPGKVLGAGALVHPVTVAAFSFSLSARSKIEAVGGETLSIAQLIDKVPSGSKVKIVS